MRIDGPYPGDRRRFPRASIVGSAILLVGGRYIGTFLLENLSAGGASLRGAAKVAVGEQVRVLLQLYRSPRRLGLEAVVVRHADAHDQTACALRFIRTSEHVQSAIQSAIMQELHEGPPTRVVLVIDPLPFLATRMAQDLDSLGRQAVTVLTALDAITWLTPSDIAVDAVIVDADLDHVDGLSMLEFIAADYPHVRRVLLCESDTNFAIALMSGVVHALLPKPWSRERLAHAVRE